MKLRSKLKDLSLGDVFDVLHTIAQTADLFAAIFTLEFWLFLLGLILLVPMAALFLNIRDHAFCRQKHQQP